MRTSGYQAPAARPFLLWAQEFSQLQPNPPGTEMPLLGPSRLLSQGASRSTGPGHEANRPGPSLVPPCFLPSSAPACSSRPFPGSQIPHPPSEGVGLAQGGGLAALMLQKTSNLLAGKLDQNSDPQHQALAPPPERSHQDRHVSSVAAGRGELTSCCKATWQRSKLLLGRLSTPLERPYTPWVPLSRRQKQRQLVLPLHTQGLSGL